MTDIPEDVVERLWRDLCEKPDRTSPPEFPDMALITLDELRAALRVGVEWEWEREQSAISAELFDGGNDGECDRTARAIAAAMRKSLTAGVKAQGSVMPLETTVLAIQKAHATGRAEALEEAARINEKFGGAEGAGLLAARIRAIVGRK
jgi:hypothetical protein